MIELDKTVFREALDKPSVGQKVEAGEVFET